MEHKIICFDYPPLNREIIELLKKSLYTDNTKCLLYNIPTNIRYYLLNNINRTISYLPDEKIPSPTIYKTSCDYTIIKNLIMYPTLEDHVLDVPYSC